MGGYFYMSKKIQLIIGSTRQNRIGASVAAWIEKQAGDNKNISLEVVDLKQENLPLMDAAVPPAYAPTTTDAGKAWAEKIAAADGYIFLTPEYNRSMPASLKNALDYLVQEWKDKPAVVVSYGYIDGGKSAARHLRDVLDWLKVDHTSSEVALHLKQEMFDETGAFKDIDSALAAYEDDLADALQHFDAAKELAATTT